MKIFEEYLREPFFFNVVAMNVYCTQTHEDIHTTHCQLTPVDPPTWNMVLYVISYLWENRVKSPQCFLFNALPNVCTVHPFYCIDVQKKFLPVFVLRSLNFYHCFSFRDSWWRINLSRLYFSRLCRRQIMQEASRFYGKRSATLYERISEK